MADTAQVASTAYVGIKACVYGEARIFDKAGVCGGAGVYGNAWVYGDAEVYEGEWNSTPLYIQGTAHPLYMSSPTELAIGCETHTLDHWLMHYEEIGRKNGYSEEQIQEYKSYIDLAVRLYSGKQDRNS